MKTTTITCVPHIARARDVYLFLPFLEKEVKSDQSLNNLIHFGVYSRELGRDTMLGWYVGESRTQVLFALWYSKGW